MLQGKREADVIEADIGKVYLYYRGGAEFLLMIRLQRFRLGYRSFKTVI